MTYRTKHKYELINYLEKHQNQHLTISKMQEDLKSIPVATLYRLVDALVEEGLLRKYIIGPNSACCFQYNQGNSCHEHFHLVCEKCGKLIHLECDEVNHLLDHIQDEHSFKIDVSRINLYGLCDECQKENR